MNTEDSNEPGVQALQAAEDLRCFAELLEQPRRMQCRGRISGLSFAVKGNMTIEGKPLTLGSPNPMMQRASGSARITELLLAQGAELTGTTAFDELCLTSTGQSRAWGQIQNPLNRAYSPLGSSAGSACAVAAGLVDFALGTDYGGSVRAPAAACGVWGLKLSPDPALTPGIALFDPQMDCPGIISREAAVLKQVLHALERDGVGCEKPHTFVIPEKRLLARCSTGVQNVFTACCKKLRLHFGIREDLSTKLVERSIAIRKTLAAFHFKDLCVRFGLKEEQLPETAMALLKVRRGLATSAYAQACRSRIEIEEQLLDLLPARNILLTPTLLGEVPLLGDEGEIVFLQTFLPLANLGQHAALAFPLQNLLTFASKIPYSLCLSAPGRPEMTLIKCAESIKSIVDTNS